MPASRHEYMTAISSFTDARRLTGSNWLLYKQEFKMVFSFLDPQLWDFVNGKYTKPDPDKDKDKYEKWVEHNRVAELAIYRTIADDSIRMACCPDSKDAPAWWENLTNLFQKDTRATRMKLKAIFYHPVHNPDEPIETYINTIVNAARDLAAIDRAVDDVDITDSIIMHLDLSWGTLKTILQTRHEDPSVQQLRDMLVEHERSMRIGDMPDSAMYGQSRSSGRSSRKRSPRRGRRNSGSDSESRSRQDSRHDLHWLEPHSDQDCSRCGQFGHLAKNCIHDMPRHIKDKVMSRTKPRSHAVVAAESGSEGEHAAAFANAGSHAFLVEEDSQDDTLVTLRPAPDGFAGFASGSGSSRSDSNSRFNSRQSSSSSRSHPSSSSRSHPARARLVQDRRTTPDPKGKVTYLTI